MGFFDFFTKKTPKSENERTYYPGGRTFGIKLVYDPDADKSCPILVAIPFVVLLPALM